MQYDWTHVFLVDGREVHVQYEQLAFFLLDGHRDLFGQVRHAHLDVAH